LIQSNKTNKNKNNMNTNKTPKHYQGKVQPWDLQRGMKSWGSVFIDSRRTDAMEYLYRDKVGTVEQRLSDAKKALHCIEEVVLALEEELKQQELPFGEIISQSKEEVVLALEEELKQQELPFGEIISQSKEEY
jgi:hypothetical protein